jgi:hypothetical protein
MAPTEKPPALNLSRCARSSYRDHLGRRTVDDGVLFRAGLSCS